MLKKRECFEEQNWNSLKFLVEDARRRRGIFRVSQYTRRGALLTPTLVHPMKKKHTTSHPLRIAMLDQQKDNNKWLSEHPVIMQYYTANTHPTLMSDIF